MLVMTSPPSGTVTFLFTDIEGSTKRWEQYPQAMRAALSRHDDLLRVRLEGKSIGIRGICQLSLRT